MIVRQINSFLFVSALAAIVVLSTVAPFPAFAQQKAEPDPAVWSFVFRVVDDDGVEIKDATIKTKVENKSISHQRLPNGNLKIVFDSKPKYLMLRCRSEGKTPINVSWRENDVPESSSEPFVIKLPTPKATGGRIVDEEGDPIEGATVYVLAVSDGQRLRPAIWDFPCKTDAEGKWTCPVTPPDVQELWIRLKHPDFISDQTYGGTVTNASIDDLQAHTHVAVMRKGITVSGNVTGPNGDAVEDAGVYQGSDRFGSHYPETKTDEDGNFVFKNCPNGPMVLTIVAEDLAPELLEITVDENFLEPIEVKLHRGKTLTIKVVDSEGNPVPKAWIPVDTWREHRSLASAKLPSRTDKNGVFVWKNAPEDVVECEVLVRGYLDHRNVKFTAREEPYIIKMVRPLIIKGTVKDAATGKSIDSFRVVPVSHWNNGDEGSPNRREAVDGRDGKYEFKFTYPREGHSVLIEAVGYVPKGSAVFKSTEGDVTFDFQLQSSSGIIGTVVAADGQPVVGAVVALIANPNEYVSINSGRVKNLDDILSTRTDEEGAFSLVSTKNKWQLFVLHDLGFAKIDADEFKSGQAIKLAQWAVIAGRDLKSVGSKLPVAIALSDSGERGRSITHQATANSEGDFELTRVAPGFTYSIERLNSAEKRAVGRMQPTGRIKVEAGTRHQILLGQPGRKVFGELQFEGRKLNASGFAKAKTKRPDYPDGYEAWDMLRQQRWQEEWYSTEEGRKFQSNRWFEYGLRFIDDSHFEIEALPPGFYELEIRLGTDGGESYLRRRKVRVKKIAAEEEVPQPQDLGVIEFSLPSKDD